MVASSTKKHNQTKNLEGFRGDYGLLILVKSWDSLRPSKSRNEILTIKIGVNLLENQDGVQRHWRQITFLVSYVQDLHANRSNRHWVACSFASFNLAILTQILVKPRLNGLKAATLLKMTLGWSYKWDPITQTARRLFSQRNGYKPWRSLRSW